MKILFKFFFTATLIHLALFVNTDDNDSEISSPIPNENLRNSTTVDDKTDTTTKLDSTIETTTTIITENTTNLEELTTEINNLLPVICNDVLSTENTTDYDFDNTEINSNSPRDEDILSTLESSTTITNELFATNEFENTDSTSTTNVESTTSIFNLSNNENDTELNVSSGDTLTTENPDNFDSSTTEEPSTVTPNYFLNKNLQSVDTTTFETYTAESTTTSNDFVTLTTSSTNEDASSSEFLENINLATTEKSQKYYGDFFDSERDEKPEDPTSTLGPEITESASTTEMTKDPPNTTSFTEISTTTTEISTTTTEISTTTTEVPTTPEPSDQCADGDVQVKFNYTSSPFSISLTWTNPIPNCTFEYLIQWGPASSAGTSEKKYIHDTNYTIENLNACEDYKIYITVIYEKHNLPATKIITTAETIEPVETLHYKKYNDTSLTVFWKIPSLVEKCVKNYSIKHYKHNKLITSLVIPATALTFNEMNGCIDNKFEVFAISEKYNSEPRSITYSEPKLNDPPIYNETQIDDDFVITKWIFGDYICRPETFHIECSFNNQKKFEVPGEFNIINNELSAKIDKVEPYTEYFCCGVITNEAGPSECSKEGTFLTKPKPPEAPRNLNITEMENKYLKIWWDPPNKWNGIEEKYNVTVEYIGLNYNLTDNCTPTIFDSYSFTLHAKETEFEFSLFMIPAAKYKISVWAKSSGGWGEEVEDFVDLEEGIPEKSQMEYTLKNSTSKNYNTTVEIKWTTPCKMNGILDGYYVKLSGKRNDYEPDDRPIELLLPSYNLKNYTNLKPEYEYTIELQVKNEKYVSVTTKTTFITPAGIPDEPKVENLPEPTVSTVSEPWSTATVYIRNDMFDQTMGTILYYAVIVATKNCQENPKSDYYTGDWPTISSDNKTCNNESRAYEATPKEWNPFQLSGKSPLEYKFTLGNGTCSELNNCNRALQPETEYFVKIRGFTKNGYSDTKLYALQTEALPIDVPVGLIVGLVVGILAIAFIIAGVLFYTKGKYNFKNWPRMETASQISPAPLPVPIKKFGSHYEKMIENPGKIKNEFQLLSTISSDVTLSTKTALLPINKKKNRYVNILPYDQTRVKLQDNNANSSDYINASFIKGYSGSNEYIATQGPTEATCPAYWQMIVEQNVKLIVMLTQFVEAGKDKCYKYFPDLKEEYDLLNDIKIQCIEEELLNVYNKRTFKVIKGNSAKKVTHIQFNLWPDFGVPDEVHHMIDFCEIIKEIKLKRPSIIVMHCSAGVGRTGTLIAFDILLQTIRDKRKVDIFGTVLNLRKQRMTMVQSERQYEFLYKCVYYVINNNKPSTLLSSKHNLNQISESNML